jgi:hypothetical protein
MIWHLVLKEYKAYVQILKCGGVFSASARHKEEIKICNCIPFVQEALWQEPNCTFVKYYSRLIP